MTTSKFKVGDRVVVTCPCGDAACARRRGHVGVIDRDRTNINSFDVRFADDNSVIQSVDARGGVLEHAPEAAGGPEDCPEGIVSFVDEVGGRVWMRQRPGTTQIRMGRIGQMGRGAFGHPEDTSDEHDVGAVIWVSTGADLSRGDPW